MLRDCEKAEFAIKNIMTAKIIAFMFNNIIDLCNLIHIIIGQLRNKSSKTNKGKEIKATITKIFFVFKKFLYTIIQFNDSTGLILSHNIKS